MACKDVAILLMFLRGRTRKSRYLGFVWCTKLEKRNLPPFGRRASTIPLPPRAVTKNPALITDKIARPFALAITWATNNNTIKDYIRHTLKKTQPKY